MRILVVTPIVPRARTGNRVTALRWVRVLRGLGHRGWLGHVDDSEPSGANFGVTFLFKAICVEHRPLLREILEESDALPVLRA